MKKVSSLFILFICAFTFNVHALNVEVSSVEVNNKTEYVEEVSKPTIDGTDIAFNLRFKDEEQKIVYKIVLKNNTKTDVVMDTEFDNNIIQYKLIDFDNNTIKANSSVTIKLELYYKDEIDESLYRDNIYTASSTFRFLISGKNGVVKGVLENPKTGVFTYSILIIGAVILLVCIFMFSKNKGMFKNFVITFLLIIPTLVIADNVFNASVDGVTTMEFVEPKRAILDIGPTVNEKMHTLASDQMPEWVETYPGSRVWHYDYGNTSHIRHIVIADSLNSEDAVEVQAEESDFKIWMWYDSGTLFFYSDEALIYYNPDSSKFFSYLSGLEEFDSFKYFHAKYLRNASNMFEYACSGVQGDFNFYLNMKTKYIENMNYMFFHFRMEANGTGTSTFELGELFTLDNCTSAYEMFNNALYGMKGNTGSLVFKLSDNFNACKVTDASYMFAFAFYYWNNITIDLGNNFNLESANTLSQFIYNSCAYATGDVRVNCGDNFNAKSASNAYGVFYQLAGNGDPENIYLDMGKNFNLESVTSMISFVRRIGEGMQGGAIDINFGDNFNACGNITSTNEFLYSTGNNADKININFGKNANFENCPEMRNFVYNFGYYSKEINIDFGDNFNAKNTTKYYEFISSIATYMPSDGVVNIDFGKNFNAESADNIFWLVGTIGCYSHKGTLNVDFGDNFNSHDVSIVEKLFTNIKIDNINIDLRDGFTLNKAKTVRYLFNEITGANSMKINFGNLNFNIDTATEVSYLFYYTANDSNSVTFENLSGFSFPNVESLGPILCEFGNNSTFENDLIFDLSEFIINKNNIEIHFTYNIGSNIKFKVHNNTLSNSGKTIKQYILSESGNLSDDNFVYVQ